MAVVPALPLEGIRRWAGDAGFGAVVEALYAELDAEIAGQGPVCRNRGACCRFDRFGHRLFVTPVELAFFLARTDGSARPPGGVDTCRYHQGGLCTARRGRPTGCRIFFCDPGSRAWQPPLTERTLARLKGLHGRFSLPYAYVDWMAALWALTRDLTTPTAGP